ncbi:Uncharacterised protein [Vibrio cholerae]|nr:Uncharacterised protein [Vibrio cholerae]
MSTHLNFWQVHIQLSIVFNQNAVLARTHFFSIQLFD